MCVCIIVFMCLYLCVYMYIRMYIDSLPVVLRGGLRMVHVDRYSISNDTAVQYGLRAGLLQWPADFLCAL